MATIHLKDGHMLVSLAEHNALELKYQRMQEELAALKPPEPLSVKINREMLREAFAEASKRNSVERVLEALEDMIFGIET